MRAAFVPDRKINMVTPAVQSGSTRENGSTSSISVDRKASLARTLSQSVIAGKVQHTRSRPGFGEHKGSRTSIFGGEREELVDMYLEDKADDESQSKKLRKEKNIRADMGFFKLLLYDFKVWYRRWRNKHQENIIFKSYIKEVESNFGSGIGALFVFIRWVFLSNVILSTLWLGLVVLPTAVTFPYNNITQGFSMKNIFDGQNMKWVGLHHVHCTESLLEILHYGAVSQSWLFYGGYPEVITNRYYLALVYLLLICLTYFGSLFVVLKSIGEGRQPAMSSSRSHRYKFSMLVLSSWDHSITSDEASFNLSKGIASILKDNMYEVKASALVESRSGWDKCKIITCRLIAWFLTIVLIGGGCTAIVFLVIHVNFSQVISNMGTGQTSNFLNVYGTTLIFSLINIIVPMCISKLPVIENYASGKLELNITLARVFCLRMANLFALVASLYSNVTKLTEECTGTVIGQEFYKLVVMDTIVHVVVQLSMAFGRYYWTMQKYEFNLSGAALVLIYRQGLVWVGTIACPVLPLAGALSNLIFFFVNYLIVSHTCKPPIKRWNQSRNTTFLMGFLLITIMFIIVPVSVAIGSAEIIQLGQSNHGMESCGPFGLEKPTAVYMKFRIQQVAWLQSTLTWVVSDSVLIAVFLILLALLYYQRVVMSGEKKYRVLLQAELKQERKDNQELMKKVQGYV